MKQRFAVHRKQLLLRYCCLLLLFLLSLPAYSQSHNQTREFWQNVSYRYNTQQMNAGVRAWLGQSALRSKGSHTEALAILENLPNETSFQNSLLQDVYISYHKEKELMRLILYNLCGSYRLANPMSDLIISKYSKDPETVAIIKRNEQARKKEAEEANRKEQMRLQQERMDDSLRQVERENEQRIRNSLRAERQKQKTLDSLINVADYYVSNIDQRSVRQSYSNNRTYYCPELKWKGMPWIYKSGTTFWERYQQQHLQLPPVELLKQGYVFVSFIIDSIGAVREVNVVKGMDSVHDRAAVDVVKSTSGKWKPAYYKSTNSLRKYPLDQEVLFMVEFK
jgi:hypothetical protein